MSLSYLRNKRQSDARTEEFICGNFMNLKPVVTEYESQYLSADYLCMVCYILNFPSIYSVLSKRAAEYKTGVVKYKHILSLVNLLLETAENDSLGFNLENLRNVRGILDDMYSIRL